MSRFRQFIDWLQRTPSYRLFQGGDWLTRGGRESALVLGLVPIAAFGLIATGGVAAATAPFSASTAAVVEAVADSDDTLTSLTVDVSDADEQAEANIDPVEQAIADFGQPDFAAILTEMFPGAEWTLSGNSYSGLTWIGPGPKPTEAELLALWPQVAQILADRRAAQEEQQQQAEAERKVEQEQRAADPTRQQLCKSIDYNALYGGDYARVLTVHYPGAQWTLNGSSYSGLTWIGPGAKPSKATLDGLMDGVALQQCLQRPLSELRARAGTSDTEEYVAGELRPKGFSDDTFTPSMSNCHLLPQVPQDGGGGSITIYNDPTGGKNFEQVVGMNLGQFACRLAQAHGWFGGKYSMGVGVNGERELIWYSSQVKASTVRSLLSSLGAQLSPPAAPAPDPKPTPDSTPEPTPDPDPTPDPTPDSNGSGDTD